MGKESGGVTNRLGERMGYAYDAGGNFQYRTNNALVQTFAVDNVNQLTGVSRSGTLTVVGGTTATAASVTVKDVTPHTLRHTLAMTLLQSGVDIAVIGLWLGHESIETTQTYLHADMAMKEAALARTAPGKTPPHRYRPNDKHPESPAAGH